jgi:galactoside O-acetyltransferase
MDKLSQTERMNRGMVYFSEDPDIMNVQLKLLEKLYDFNATRPSELDKREVLYKEMFCSVGKNCYIEPPLHSNWAGAHVHLGDNFYANFNLTLVDDEHIYIGDNVMIAPNVVIATASHPIYPTLRTTGAQFNLPVHIGNRVWIGAGAIILPGVTIGDDTVIGAGSVVTKDIPSGVVAVGNPCKVMRPIGERDLKYYYKDKEIDWENLPDTVKPDFMKNK